MTRFLDSMFSFYNTLFISCFFDKCNIEENILYIFNSFEYILLFLVELRTSLEEHQSALELIMSKYREQMFRLLMASKKDDPGIILKLKEQHSKVIHSVNII